MNIVYKNVDELIPYEKNTKKHDKKQIKNVATSIDKYGFVQPLVIDKNNVVIIGHCRLLGAKQLKMHAVPCVCADDLTEEQVNALRIVDNKSNESEWDMDLLADELGAVDLGDFDFDFGIAFDEEPTEIVEDEAPEIDEESESITKLGDIWQLGRHRLMCGDSTDKETVERLMDGTKADMVFTDPPYGMKKESEGVINDNLNYDDLLEFNKKWIPLTFEALKNNGNWYCWGIDEPLMDIYSEILKPKIKANEITFRNYVTWDKGNGQGQMDSNRRQYATATEKCLFVMCGVQGFNTNADNYFEEWEPIRQYLCESKKAMGWSNSDLQRITGVSTFTHYFSRSQWEFPNEENYKKMQAAANGDAFKREYDDLKREYDDLKREYYATRAYFDNTHDNMNDVWHFSRTSADERKLTGGHATPKPIALCTRAIKSSSRNGEVVLDVFGGSGSTLIACEQLDRICYTMELDPKYCDVIVKRWENITGEKAVLINK